MSAKKLTGTLSNLRPRQGGQVRDAALRRVAHVVPVVVVGRPRRAGAGRLGVARVVERRPVTTRQGAELTLTLGRHRAAQQIVLSVTRTVPQSRRAW